MHTAQCEAIMQPQDVTVHGRTDSGTSDEVIASAGPRGYYARVASSNGQLAAGKFPRVCKGVVHPLLERLVKHHLHQPHTVDHGPLWQTHSVDRKTCQGPLTIVLSVDHTALHYA